tara:strand:- start:5320 stop:5685 length:366 start_codon:yes stop_codon:yes gene_type:complete
MYKINSAYKTIGEVVKILNIYSKVKSPISAHTLRYWEKEFKQLRPKNLNSKRRYYSEKDVEILKKIVFLLKDKGMTIAGARKILNENKIIKLDELSDDFIRKANFKNKITKISSIIKTLKD